MLNRAQALEILEHHVFLTQDTINALEAIVKAYYPGDEVLLRDGKRAKIKRLATVWQPGLYLLELFDGSEEQHRYDHISHARNFPSLSP
jgi:hypothetical protein